MYCFNSMIKDEIESLDYLIAKYEEKPHDCIRGSLGFRKRNGSLSYYVSNSSSEDGKRVHKTEVIGDEYSEAVQSIKVSRFNHEVLKRLKSNRSLLGKISGNYKDYSPVAVYRELPNAYMDLPRECFVDERYEELKEWAREEYVRNGREMPRLANVTVTGEQVRSKGEAIIYNMATDNSFGLGTEGGTVTALGRSFVTRGNTGAMLTYQVNGSSYNKTASSVQLPTGYMAFTTTDYTGSAARTKYTSGGNVPDTARFLVMYPCLVLTAYLYLPVTESTFIS